LFFFELKRKNLNEIQHKKATENIFKVKHSKKPNVSFCLESKQKNLSKRKRITAIEKVKKQNQEK